MKKVILIILIIGLLTCYALMAMGSESADFLPFLDSGDEKNDGENGSSDEKTEKIEKKVMPNVVGMLADEAQTTLKKAGIKAAWEYKQSYIKDTSHDAYIIQKYGNQAGNAPQKSYLKYWKVKSQSVKAGQEGTESATLTMDLNVTDITNKNISSDDLIIFTGTIIAFSKSVSTGLLGRIEFKVKKTIGNSENEEKIYFWAYDGPASKHIEIGSTFRVVGRITEQLEDDLFRIDILGMDYKGKN